ncbi:hypothetical protein HY440_02215 [Candidatus Microgenomates bacterium]|nr:hypothetical protein [Candidatus Microgenomates bacterium]
MAKKILSENTTTQQAMMALAEGLHQAQEAAFGKKDGAKDTEVDVPFEKAKEELATVPELVVYVPAELPEVAVGRLGRKARTLFGEALFINFKVDATLIGGAALAWRGQYKDYSIKSKFTIYNLNSILKY